MSGNTFYWCSDDSSGAFDSTNWINPAVPTTSTTCDQGPPGASDTAVFDVAATISGSGTADILTIFPSTGSVTFTGTITGNTLALADSVLAYNHQDLILSGGVLTVNNNANIGAENTLQIINGATLVGPTSDQIAGVEDFGTISLDQGAIQTYRLDTFGTLLQTGGTVTATTFEVGGYQDPYFSETGSLALSGGTLNDTLALIGIGLTESSTATVTGGTWNSKQLLVGSYKGAVLSISGSATVSATGGFQVVPQVTAAIEVGGVVNTVSGLQQGSGTLTLDGPGAHLNVTGDAGMGDGGVAQVTLSNGASLDITGTLTGGSIALNGSTLLGTTDITLTDSTLTVGKGIALTDSAGTLSIGANGSLDGPVKPGTMTIAPTVNVNGGQITGYDFDALGPVNVTNGTITAPLVEFGTNGTAETSTLDSGGFINAAIAGIGQLSGDKDILRMLAGSSLQVSMQLFVGASGHGGLDVEGGTVNVDGGVSEGSAALDLGALAAGSLGTIAMDGAGSTLHVTGAAVLGDAGAGSLLLGTKSTFTVDFGLYEGVQATAGGTLQVTDSSDVLSVGSDWVIGDAGNHVDLIEGGASVSVGGSLTLARGGGTGILTLTDTGTVVNVTGDVTVGQSGSATLQVEAGAMLMTSAGAFSVLAGSADVGATAEVSAATATLGGGGTLTLAGGTLATSGSVEVHGTLSGNGTITGALVDAGQVNASGGTLLVQGSVSGTGEIGVANGTLELQSAIAAGPTIGFAGGEVILDVPGATGVTFSGFGAGDTLVLKGVIANAGTFAGGVLTLDDGGAQQAALAFAGSYAADGFAVSTAGSETTVTAAPCFAAGTRILTAGGEVPVEALSVGARVRTAAGGWRRVRWLGHRHVVCAGHKRPQDVQPVRVRRDAFGPGRPARDILLSPDHAVFADGVLIPVRYLLNGRTVVQEAVAAVTYWHVELTRHDVILAEGLACESYLDTGNRAAFTGGGAVAPPAAALRIWRTRGCAPLVRGGPALAAVRRAVLAQAERLGHARTADPDLRVLTGRHVLPAERDGARWRVQLPDGARTVRLRSRIWVPAETGAVGNDTRHLGVAIGRLWLDGRVTPLDGPAPGTGWAQAEPGWRWTTGEARLAVAGARTLHFDLAITGTYWRI